MSRRTSTAAVLLSSAALFTGAPATALAHHGHDGRHGAHHGMRHHHHHGGGLARTAHELGVTKQQLRTALKAVAEQQRAASRPPSFMDLFASQLGTTTDKVKAAFKQARESGAHSKDEFLAAFASALGTDSTHVMDAMKAARSEQKAQWKAAREAFINALADQLNLPADTVAAAFNHRCGFKHH
jgi:hypothetical protein